ncbi:hypothetical protein P7C70_g5569, partial [Phenoliferia sp. Uapishka_3]
MLSAQLFSELGKKFGTFNEEHRGRDHVPDDSADVMAGGIITYFVFRVGKMILTDYDRNVTPLSNFGWDYIIRFQLWFIVMDCFFYSYHRSTHEFDFLWRIHQQHHRSKAPTMISSALAGHAQHFIEIILIPSMTTYIVPMSFHEQWVLYLCLAYVETIGHSGIRIHVANTNTWLSCLPFGADLNIEDHDLHHRYGKRNYVLMVSTQTGQANPRVGQDLRDNGGASGDQGILSCLTLAYLASTTFSPALQRFRLPTTPIYATLQALLLAWAASEAIFSIFYQIWALRTNRHRPSTNYDPKFLRDIVKKVLESNMSDNEHAVDDFDSTSLSSSPPSVGMRRRRHGTISSNPDSGYASSSSSASSSFSKQLHPEYNFITQRLSFDDHRAQDFRETARHWFHGAPFEEVRREDASQWMAWSLYGTPYEEVVKERRNSVTSGVRIERMERDADVGRDKLETVDYSVDLWEARAGVKLAGGTKSNVGVVRITLDKLKVMTRPLGLYLGIWAAQKYYKHKCRRMGFEERLYEGLRYWIRIPNGWKSSEVEESAPLLFLHGLGVGPVGYAPILNKLATDPDFQYRPIVILIQPHLSMSIFDTAYLTPPDASACNTSLKALAKLTFLARQDNRFEDQGFTTLSHSNGTIVHGWLLKGSPNLIRRSLIVDPVCFALWEPHLPYQFLYAPAKAPMSHLMRYFVSRELGVANVLQRHFDWISSVLWLSDVPEAYDPSKFAVHLSEKDAIVDTPRIRNYLAGEGLKEGEGLKVFPKQKHGDSMLGHGKGFNAVLSWLRGDC